MRNRSNPRDVLTAIKRERSFAGRVRTARAMLGKPIGAGSGRVVFDLGDGTVLKIAKNPKGVSQNGMETDGFVQQSYSDIVAPVIDSDSDDLWLVMAKAKKVGTKRFEQLIGIPSRKTSYGSKLSAHYLLLAALRMLWDREHLLPGQTARMQSSLTEGNTEQILSIPFVEQLVSLMRDMDMPPGDFGRLSTYGELNGRLVLVDYGLSSGVWAEHYSRNRSKYWGAAS